MGYYVSSELQYSKITASAWCAPARKRTGFCRRLLLPVIEEILTVVAHKGEDREKKELGLGCGGF